MDRGRRFQQMLIAENEGDAVSRVESIKAREARRCPDCGKRMFRADGLWECFGDVL